MEPPSDELDGPSVEYDDKPLLNEIFDDAQERFETWASKFFAPVTEPAARAWRVLLRHELTLLWWFRVTPGGRRLSRFVAPFISNHPFVDISVVTWAAYAGVVWKWGLRPFYCGALNLVAAFALRGLLALPRPCEYDPRLRQFADRGRGGGGFPSLESHMAVVVYGMCAIGAPAEERGAAWLAVIAASSLVGLTRLVAGSRFAHQVLLSYATGGVGLGLGYTYSRYLPRFHLAKSGHTVAIYVIVSYFIAYLGHFAMVRAPAPQFRAPRARMIPSARASVSGRTTRLDFSAFPTPSSRACSPA